MGWNKLIIGEKMPDKNDSQYAGQYEKEVNARRKFARILRIDKAAACVQRFACSCPKLFFAIVFGIVISCFSLNIYRVVKICNRPKTEKTSTVVSHQEQLLKEKRVMKTINIISNDTDRPKEQD